MWQFFSKLFFNNHDFHLSNDSKIVEKIFFSKIASLKKQLSHGTSMKLDNSMNAYSSPNKAAPLQLLPNERKGKKTLTKIEVYTLSLPIFSVNHHAKPSFPYTSCRTKKKKKGSTEADPLITLIWLVIIAFLQTKS